MRWQKTLVLIMCMAVAAGFGLCGLASFTHVSLDMASLQSACKNNSACIGWGIATMAMAGALVWIMWPQGQRVAQARKRKR